MISKAVDKRTHARIDSKIVRQYLSVHIELGQIDLHIAGIKRQASTGTRIFEGRLVLLLCLVCPLDDGSDDGKDLEVASLFQFAAETECVGLRGLGHAAHQH